MYQEGIRTDIQDVSLGAASETPHNWIHHLKEVGSVTSAELILLDTSRFRSAKSNNSTSHTCTNKLCYLLSILLILV
jgi:hypothetical protein